MSPESRPGSRSESHAGSGAASGGARRPRSRFTKAYVTVALVGGICATVVLAGELTAAVPSVLDVLLWSALALLLFGAAAHEWWFAGRAKDRSRDLAAGIEDAEVEQALLASANEVEAIRRIRVAHPELRLRDAYHRVERHRRVDR